jgi:hypothetical protein
MWGGVIYYGHNEKAWHGKNASIYEGLLLEIAHCAKFYSSEEMWRGETETETEKLVRHVDHLEEDYEWKT